MGNRFTTQVIKRDYGLNPEKPISVIIPAAGMGYRMRSYGPKHLISLDANQNIIQRQIKIIQNNFINYDLPVGLFFLSPNDLSTSFSLPITSRAVL